MEVIDKRRITKVLFCKIEQGECFIDDVGNVLMKIDSGGNLCNSVLLKSGEVVFFCGDEKVQPVKSKITLY